MSGRVFSFSKKVSHSSQAFEASNLTFTGGRGYDDLQWFAQVSDLHLAGHYDRARAEDFR